MKSKDWYKREYGDDWWEIVWQQDNKEDKCNKQIEKWENEPPNQRNQKASWMSDGINQ